MNELRDAFELFLRGIMTKEYERMNKATLNDNTIFSQVNETALRIRSAHKSFGVASDHVVTCVLALPKADWSYQVVSISTYPGKISY